jgi:ABC-type polysaccharide/polyol phosphate export permease
MNRSLEEFVNAPHQAIGGPASLERVIWRHRELLYRLVVRNLQVKFQRSLLGFAWTFLNPLVTVGVLSLVFSYVVRIPLPAYWAFLLSGYFVWNFIIQTLNTGTYVFVEHARLLRSAAFPAEILVLGAAIAKLIEFAGALVLVLIAIVVFHHQGVPTSFWYLPLLIVCQLLMVIGLTLPIASLSAFYHDVQHVLPIALTTLFYASPVFYPVSLVPESIRGFFMLNPLAGLLTLYHDVVYAGRTPSIELLITVFLVSLVICFVGYVYFRRLAYVYAEVV